ncbi:MAG: HAD hydrolase-like protein [Deltaproteobacteria bacterium]|nr:HAD hydrolase-like protein [Deltaproteobacteria bacterium]
MTFKSQQPTDGAIIFDLDGTLVDTSGDITFTTNHVRDLIGLPPLSSRQVLRAVGHGFASLLSRLTDVDENEVERIEQLREQFRRHYLAHQTERSEVYPGIREALTTLAPRFSLFVLSNKPHIAVLSELDGHAIRAFFRDVWGGGALPAIKPDPVGVIAALEQSGVPSSRAVMVGDMTPDIGAAENAGIKSCFVTWGFGALENEDPKPTVAIDRVDELVPTIEHLLASE